MEDTQQKHMDFFDYVQMASRQKGIIIICACLTVIVALAYVLLARPIYQANAKLLIIDEKSRGALGIGSGMSGDMMLSQLGNSDPIATQIEVLRTRPLHAETVRRLDIKDRKGRLISATMSMSRFKFTALRLTNIISIQCRYTNPDTAALMVNTLAQVFIENNQNLNQEEIRTARKFIEEQLVDQRQAVQKAEDSLVEFKSRTAMTTLDRETGIRVTAMAQLEAEKLSLEAELIGALAQKHELDQRLGEAGAQSAPYFSSWMNSRESAIMTESGLRARIAELNAQLHEQAKDLKDLPPLEKELARLLREQQIATEIYTTLLSQYEEYKIREAAKIASAKLIEPAISPETPTLPKPKRTMAFSLIMGLVAGTGAAFFIEYLRDRPRSVDEIKNILHTNSLGVVPWTEDLPPLFMRDTPATLASETIRLVHTNLKFKGVMEKGHITLMTTSSQPDEGKTTIAINLALEFASHGKKTCIVTLDLRRPTFAMIFKLERHKKGVTDYLIGEAALEQIIVQPITELLNLSVIPSGTVPPNPTELIGLPRMRELVQILSGKFDAVIFDTAPITMVAETLDIARSMDGIILVADISEASRRSLMSMHDLLSDKKLPLLGVVINKYGKGTGGKYGYYHYRYGKYRYYKKYGYYTNGNNDTQSSEKQTGNRYVRSITEAARKLFRG